MLTSSQVVTWKCKISVTAGELVPVPASNMRGEQHGPAFQQASQRYSWGAGSSASGKPSACPVLAPQSQAESQSEQGTALPIHSQQVAVLLSRAGGHQGTSKVPRFLKLGGGGQAHFLYG